eukprot:gnl/Chilomastix_caulleri/3709.p1 GENE.gnl/Chilomastix_caulleri/3709~~gnl/Chilomastix_caulleri/3709.p1  ORF type:complete len:121 (+),score=43.77 gnl/Chilomastix_caulleri/3709:408-770(+)
MVIKELFKPSVDVCVIPRTTELRGEAMKISKMLREEGLTTSLYVGSGSRAGVGFKYAERVGAMCTVFIAEAELEAKSVKVKDYRADTQGKRGPLEELASNESIVPIAELGKVLRELLGKK